MKKANEALDKSTPYRNVGSTMIKAPVKAKNEPKAVSTKTSGDLRTRGGK